ncbi:uncharacterized protein LOC144579515 [Callithrix jacchus]
MSLRCCGKTTEASSQFHSKVIPLEFVADFLRRTVPVREDRILRDTWWQRGPELSLVSISCHKSETCDSVWNEADQSLHGTIHPSYGCKHRSSCATGLPGAAGCNRGGLLRVMNPHSDFRKKGSTPALTITWMSRFRVCK